MGSLEDDLTEHHRMNKRDEEIARLRAKYDEMTKRAETAEDTIGCQTDLEKDFATTRAELALMERQRDHHAQLLDKSDAENWKLKTELAAMTKRAETAEDTVGCQTDLEKDFAAVHAEIVPLRKRLAGLEALGKRMSLAADSNGLGWMPLFEEARATFRGIAELNND